MHSLSWNFYVHFILFSSIYGLLDCAVEIKREDKCGGGDDVSKVFGFKTTVSHVHGLACQSTSTAALYYDVCNIEKSVEV